MLSTAKKKLTDVYNVDNLGYKWGKRQSYDLSDRNIHRQMWIKWIK